LKIKIEKEKLIGNGNKAVVVSLKGRMDTDAAAEFEKEISTLINEGKDSFVINFKELEYISSMGLMVTLSIAKQLKSQKGQVHASNLNGTVKEAFEAFKRDRTGMGKKENKLSDGTEQSDQETQGIQGSSQKADSTEVASGKGKESGDQSTPSDSGKEDTSGVEQQKEINADDKVTKEQIDSKESKDASSQTAAGTYTTEKGQEQESGQGLKDKLAQADKEVGEASSQASPSPTDKEDIKLLKWEKQQAESASDDMWKKEKMEEDTLSHMAQEGKIFVTETMAKIECKLLDGKSISGQLERPFRPMEEEVAIRSQGKVHVFPLNHVCCVLFAKADGEHYPPRMPGETVEDVETRGKEVYKVRVLQQQMDDIVQGFYGIPSSRESGISRIFFPKTGIIIRSEHRPIGEILKAGNVSKDSIQYALGEQQRLRNLRVGEIVAKKNNIPQETIDNTLNAWRKHDKSKNDLIGDVLVACGLATSEQIDEAIKEQHLGEKKYLGKILIEHKIITENELMMALALKYRLRFVDLRDISPNQETLDMVPADIVRRLHIFPISSDESKMTIATSNPNDIKMHDTLRFLTKRWVEMTIATSEQIETYIHKYYDSEGKDDDTNIEIDAAISELELEDQKQSESLNIEVEVEAEAESLKIEAEAAPIIRLANKILIDGVKADASDIHLLPEEKGLKVSFRVNGLLQQHLKLDQRLHKNLVARFKIVALMDIAERRLPQDGRFRVKLKNRHIEFRVSCMPSKYGESLVLRILDKSSRVVGLSQLGLDAKDVESINHIVRSTHGMLLVTGPTGSGKSTTLASVLSDLVDEPKHKLSLEDPIEIEIPGIDQIQIHEKIGFTFAAALRNVLRHDPDIIMVGEIRDPETAKIAVQAALTGHVLISTLHTNHATAAFSRLVDMGVEPYMISATVKGIMAQHLFPRLCEECRSACEPDAKVLEFFTRFGLDTRNLVDHVSTGCDHCRNSGVSGRILLYEFLNVNLELQKLVAQNTPSETIQAAACKLGMRPIVDMAVETAQKGLISLDRILPLFIE